MKRERSVVSAASNLVTTWLNLLISVVTGVIIARALGPDGKGEFTSLRILLALYPTLFVFGYHGGVMYHGIRKDIFLPAFFITGLGLMLTLSLLIVPVMWTLLESGLLGKIVLGIDGSVLWVALSAIPLILLNAYIERIIRAYHFFKASNLRLLSGSSAMLLFYWVMLTLGEVDLVIAFWGVFVGQVVQLLLSITFVYRYVGFTWNFDSKNVFMPFRYGIQNWLNQLLNTYSDKLDMLLLSYLLTSAGFGIYAVGVTVSQLVASLPTGYINVFYNRIVGKDTLAATAVYSRMQRITFLLTSVAMLFLLVAGYPLIKLIYGMAYLKAYSVLVLYAPGVVFQVAARFSIKYYAAIGKPLRNSLVYIAGLFIGAPLYFFLIPKYGVLGAAAGSTVSYFGAFVFSYLQVWKDSSLGIGEVMLIRREDMSYLLTQVMHFDTVRNLLARKGIKSS